MRALHKVGVGWILGIDIPATAIIGSGLRIMHGTGLVIHDRAIIGRDCTLRHGVTLGIRGRAKGEDGPPHIGNSVNIGSGAQILGPVTVGDNAQIGAGAVVLRDVPSGATAVGNPARILERL